MPIKYKIYSRAILFMLFVLALVFLFQYQHRFNYLNQITAASFLILTFFSWFAALLNGLRVKIYAALFNIPLNFQEWFGLAQVSTLGNAVSPFRGGASLRALYLKRHYDFPYRTFLVTVASNALIVFLAYSFIGMAALIMIGKGFNLWMFLIFLAVFICSLAVIIYPENRILKITPLFLKETMKKLLDGWLT